MTNDPQPGPQTFTVCTSNHVAALGALNNLCLQMLQNGLTMLDVAGILEVRATVLRAEVAAKMEQAARESAKPQIAIPNPALSDRILKHPNSGA